VLFGQVGGPATIAVLEGHDDLVGTVPNDDVVVLRTLTLDDVDEWMTGEDAEQIRWFEFPWQARAKVA